MLKTLQIIMDCDPRPSEILVHIDVGDEMTEEKVSRVFPSVKIYQSAMRRGPGGGRNILIKEAKHDIVASFDDDSYPLDKDYFARLSAIIARYPQAAVIASAIVHRGEKIPEDHQAICMAVSFVGCGAALRKNDFREAGGYVALPWAYGMEETDLVLRLMAHGKMIYFCPWLRVFHDTDLSHHASAEINAAAISNIALLAFLRYPVRYMPYAGLQVLNRVFWSVKAGRFQGIMKGLFNIPGCLWRYRKLRSPISTNIFNNVLHTIRQGNKRLEPIKSRTL